MGRKIVLLNGSPRAPKSNSKRYAAIFREHCPVAADYFEITRRNGYPFGSVLMIGGGEAILDTPFRLLAGRRIAAFARAVAEGRAQSMHVTMPITKRMFVWASDIYWRMYGRRHGVSKRQMESMRIE